MKRKIYKLLSSAKQGLFALALTAFLGTAHSQTTYTFSYTGSVQTINLQAGTYTLETWGADGGDNLGNGSTTFLQNGGKGGYSIGIYTLTSAATIYVYAGGRGGNSTTTLNVTVPGGYNGGGYGSANSTAGKSSGAGGGGATHLATVTGTLGALASNTPAVLIVAGGGGGAGESNYANTNTQYNSNGGNGGGASGAQDVGTGYQGRHGQGGTQVAGGGGGDNGSAVAGVPLQGIFGAGGYNPATGVNTSAGGSGAGGGGGGWYGGGSGWVATGTAYMSGSGGGGSGYIGGVNSGTTIMNGQAGFVANPDITGNGSVKITELCSITLTASGSNSLNPSICSGQSLTLTTNGISNYVWSTGNTTTPTIAVSPAITTVYTLSATSPSSCAASRSMTVIVNSAAPALTFATAPSSTVCLGQTATLTAGGAVSYTLAGGPGNLTNGQTFTPTTTSNYTITGQNGCGTASVVTTITVAPLPVSVIPSSTLVCAGTPATLSASGATTFTWMPGNNTSTNYIISPPANTIYTLTGTAGPCTGSTVININTKPNPTLAITVVGSSTVCEGNSANLTVNGNAITYTWSTGQSGTSISPSPTMATLYSVIGTNSVNCTSSTSQVILVNNNPLIQANASDIEVCSGGPSTLTASGADTYQWSFNAGSATSSAVVVNPTSNQSYTIIGNSTAGCSSNTIVTVSVFIPTVTVSGNTSVCLGSSAQLSAAGADSFAWSNGGLFSTNNVTPTLTTVYTVTGTANQDGLTCTNTNTVSVTVNPLPVITASSTRTNICVGENTTIDPAGGTSYTWTSQSGPLTGPTVTVHPIVDQTYTVTGVDANGCKNKGTIQVKVFACTGIPVNGRAPANLLVYPNPGNGEITITFDEAISLQITNELGQLIRTISISNTEKELKINNLSAGVYFITGHNANGSVEQKLIITK